MNNIGFLLRKNALNYIKKLPRRNFVLNSILSKEVAEDDTPIKFSTSPASKYRAQTSRKGISIDRLWYEPYVIIASIAVFMIYFTILREENDVDDELGRSLYSRIDGLEEFQLRQSLEYNRSHGKDTTDIIKRLEEIEAEKDM